MCAALAMMMMTMITGYNKCIWMRGGKGEERVVAVQYRIE